MARSSTQLSLTALLILTVLPGCIGDDDRPSGVDAAGPHDAGFVDVDSSVDSGDAGPSDGESIDVPRPDGSSRDVGSYDPSRPPDAAVPAILSGDRWVRHWNEDVRPFWVAPEAEGTPLGNFPTDRGMDGQPAGSTNRRPRMIGRQVYAYSMGFALTGDPRLLELAHAGVEWLRAHAKDTTRGGWYGLLDSTGRPIASQPKLTQDTAYVMLGMSAYHFVTRDPAAESELLETRDLLFDPATYFDLASQLIRDGMSDDLSSAVDVENDGGSELVAQLDPVNAFLLLSQPLLTEPDRRDLFLDDLRTLAETIVERFLQDGIFFGVDTNLGRFGTKHVDFGHTLKTYWMLLQIDKRLPDHPFAPVVFENAHSLVQLAFDEQNGLWAKRPTSRTAVEYGSDWWIYAELDQIAATLDLIDWRYAGILGRTGAGWVDKYVDPTYPAREVIPSINRQGSRVYAWQRTDTAKCNEWKNGFHSTEHALVMYLHGRAMEGAPATLFFAVPESIADTFEARPYTWLGTEIARTKKAEISIFGQALRVVEVSWTGLF